jgi:hypothetical protein
MKDYAPRMKSLKNKTLKDTLLDFTYNRSNFRTLAVGGAMLITALSTYPIYQCLEISRPFTSSETRQLSAREREDFKLRQQHAMQEVGIVEEDKVVEVVSKKNLSLEPQLIDSTIHYLQLGVFGNKEGENKILF